MRTSSTGRPAGHERRLADVAGLLLDVLIERGRSSRGSPERRRPRRSLPFSLGADAGRRLASGRRSPGRRRRRRARRRRSPIRRRDGVPLVADVVGRLRPRAPRSSAARRSSRSPSPPARASDSGFALRLDLLAVRLRTGRRRRRSRPASIATAASSTPVVRRVGLTRSGPAARRWRARPRRASRRGRDRAAAPRATSSARTCARGGAEDPADVGRGAALRAVARAPGSGR